MITPSDPEYESTKQLKRGSAKLAPLFKELAAWIGWTWKVTVLNVIYDPPGRLLKRPRLKIILEHEADVKAFRDGLNFDGQKQQAITQHFQDILRHGTQSYDVEGLFVVFSAFAPIARQEADSKISEQQLAEFKRHIPDLWEISRLFGTVTFMFYTDAQARAYAAQGKKDEYSRLYLELLKPHDEFGYLSPETYAVAFDSKQNFDENYGSSWFNYTR